MFKNYFLTAIRSIKKNYVYALINILGLAIAISICITAFYNNKWNWDFNKVHKNYDYIYKINVTKKDNNQIREYAFCPMPIGSKIKEDIPQVENVVNYNSEYYPVKHEEKVFNQRIGYASESFAEVFTLKMIKGNKSAIGEKNKILLSEDMVEKFFHKKNPVGEVISVFNNNGNEHTFIVGGVFENYPLNTSFYFDAITGMDNYIDMKGIDRMNWHQNYDATFLYIKNKSQLSEVKNLIQNYIPVQNKARQDWKINNIDIEPLKTIHKTIRDRWARIFRHGLHPAQVKTAPVMAILILLIACFNFINTSIAFTGNRLKEIGIRKTFGGMRKQLIIQFLLENFILIFIAIIIGVYFSSFIIDSFSQMWSSMNIKLTLTGNPKLIVYIVGLLLLTTLLAGAYPAFYISSFQPIRIFRSKVKLGDNNKISRGLLILQFFISVVVLFLGVVFAQNAQYQKNMNLGYEKDKVMFLNINNNKDYSKFEQVIKENPDINSFAGTRSHIGYGGYYTKMFRYRNQEHESDLFMIGINYLRTMGVNLKEGRFFKQEFEKSDIKDNSVIVNEKFVESYNWDEPLNKIIYKSDTTKMRVVGIVKDFYLNGPWFPIKPTVFQLTNKDHYDRLVMQVKEGKKEAINQHLKKQWRKILPNRPYNSTFQEEVMAEAIRVNQNSKDILIFLAIVASMLSAVGLFSLVSLRVISKTKEIGIRKVLGADIPSIMKKIGKPYIIIVSISLIFGLTAGYFMSNILMASVWSEFINPNIVSFLLPLLLILIVASVTVTGKIYKAALKNPTMSLRYE